MDIYTDIDFALYLGGYPNGGLVEVYEGGVGRGSFGTYATGDVMRVAVEGGVVKYKKNGVVFYTSTVAPAYPLLVDSAFYSNGSAISNVVMSGGGGDGGSQNVTWTGASGVAVNSNSLTKTTGEGWNAGAASVQTIASGDGYVEFTASETNTFRMLGLSHGDSNQNYTDIDFALYLGGYPNGGVVEVYEGGVHRGTFGSYATGDVMRVAVEGGVVKYKKNGVVFYTSTVAPTYPLLVDTALYSNGATLTNVVVSGGGGGGGGSPATIRWVVTDRLGTPRMIIDQSGSLASVSRHDYLPFGEELYAGVGGRTSGQGYTNSDSVRQHFTGYERDAESGLDYAQARYYSNHQGRFTSVDPLGASASIADPQSFNRYAYVNNNPINFVDPSGLMLSDIGVYQTDNPEAARTAERKMVELFRQAINPPPTTSRVVGAMRTALTRVTQVAGGVPTAAAGGPQKTQTGADLANIAAAGLSNHFGLLEEIEANTVSGIDVHVVACQAAHESAYASLREIAVSPLKHSGKWRSEARGADGEIGLLQIFPSTAGLSADALKPVAANVKAGSSYLLYLQKHFNLGIRDALAVYNWGPGNFNKVDRDVTRIYSGSRSYAARIVDCANRLFLPRDANPFRRR